jgi:hypothetical protein
MLNPSTADESTDDPTIRRCIGFANALGFGALAVGNLFAYRSTTPQSLRFCIDPVGSQNDRWLIRLHEESSLTVAAWGNHGRLLGRTSAVRRLLPGLYILGLTRLGEARHPLYVRSHVQPILWLAAGA